MALVDCTILVDPSQVAVSLAAAPTVQVTPVTANIVVEGLVGIRGPSGSNNIAGKPVTASGLTQGDHLEFSGEAWVNTHKTTLTDGGNF